MSFEPKHAALRDRFMALVVQLPDAPGCWLWLGKLQNGGYGAFWLSGRFERAHRVSRELHRDAIAAGLVVCHRCDVPCCVNPEHLFVGTQIDNMADCGLKGRRPYGARRPFARLTEASVRLIRASNEPTATLAKRLGVSWPTVQKVRDGYSWRHV